MATGSITTCWSRRRRATSSRCAGVAAAAQHERYADDQGMKTVLETDRLLLRWFTVMMLTTCSGYSPIRRRCDITHPQNTVRKRSSGSTGTLEAIGNTGLACRPQSGGTRHSLRVNAVSFCSRTLMDVMKLKTNGASIMRTNKMTSGVSRRLFISECVAFATAMLGAFEIEALAQTTQRPKDPPPKKDPPKDPPPKKDPPKDPPPKKDPPKPRDPTDQIRDCAADPDHCFDGRRRKE